MSNKSIFGAIAVSSALAGCVTTGTTPTAPSTDAQRRVVTAPAQQAPVAATIQWGSEYCQSHMEGGRSDAGKLRDKIVSGATSLDKECVSVSVGAKSNRQLPTWTSYGQLSTPNCKSAVENTAGKVAGFFSLDQKREAAASEAACAADKASLRTQFFGYVAGEKAAYVAENKLAKTPAATVDSLVNATFDATFDIGQLTGVQSRAAGSSAVPAVPAEIRRNVPGAGEAQRIIRDPAGAAGRAIRQFTR